MKLVCTDLDGTLVDTRRANFQAYRDALRDVGVNFTWDAFLLTWGRDARDFLPDIAPGLELGTYDAVRARKAAIYGDYLDQTSLNEGLVAVLRALRSAGSMVTLVTTAKRRNAEQVLRHHAIDTLFHGNIYGDSVTHGKPHAEPYLAALEAASVKAADAVTFEDSATGIASAVAAGVRVVEVVFHG